MKPAEVLRAYRKIINPPYQDKDWFIIGLTLFILISIPLTAIAVLKNRGLIGKAVGTSTLNLSPSFQLVDQGTTFSVQVRENSGLEPVNAVQANLTYDATKLDFVSLDSPPSGTLFTTVAEGSGGAGSIRIARALAGGAPVVTGDQLVATVTFRAKYIPGATAVSFAAGSAVVRSTDNIDILGSTTGGTYTVVDPPPYNVAITTPANNSIVKGTSVLVQATASDDLAVTKVEFYVDSETSPRSTVTAAPYQFTLNTTSPLLADGAHTISAKAYDAHSTTTSAPINVTVDNNAPTNVTITSPVANAFVRQSVNIQTSPQDTPGSGMDRVEFYIDGSLKSTDVVAPYEYPWNTTTSIDKSYPLYVKAYDKASNVTTSATINVTVDNSVPTVSITSPTGGAYVRGSVDATASPNDANLLSVEFSLDATLKCTVTASPYTCTNIITASTSDGPHTISAKANDKAGNSTTQSVPVTVDNTVPTAPTGLEATAVSSTRIDLTWTAATDTNLAGYDVYRGGTKINPALVTTTNYNDTTGLNPATSYSYYVKALDKAGNVSAASNTASATTKKTADITGDGKVDIYDLSTLLSRWGSSDAAADLNSNGIVDIFDLSILLSGWGS
jgi:hypothetical protein